MPPRSKVLGNGTIGGKEALGVSRCVKPLHPALPLTGGLVRVLGAIIEVPMPAMFHAGQDLPRGRAVARQFVGDDDRRDVPQTLQELPEESLRGNLVSPALHQDVEDIPVLIDGPPQIRALAIDRQKHLIQVPLVTWMRTSAPELIGIRLPKLHTPLADRFIGHDHPTCKQQLFDIR